MFSSSTKAYIIIRLDENAQPVEIIPYNDDTATYVATCIHICRGMLRTPMVKDAFKKLAEDIYRKPVQDSNPEPSAARDQNSADYDAVDAFFDMTLKCFPLVFVDDSISNPNKVASHHRRAWVDGSDGFDMRSQGIKLNGPRVRDMCIAGKEAERSNDPDSHEQKRFRAFLFIFATTFLHELGHVFVTFFGLSDLNTPPHIQAKAVVSSKSTLGEAGLYLEEEIFGGVIAVMRNPDEGNDQAGICLLYKEDGSFTILQEAIDEITRYEFNFPISHLGARTSGPLKTLGYGLPKSAPSRDPMDAPGTSELLARHTENPFNWAKELEKLMAENPNPGTFSKDQESIMGRVPFEPSLLIQGPPEQLAQAAN